MIIVDWYANEWYAQICWYIIFILKNNDYRRDSMLDMIKINDLLEQESNVNRTMEDFQLASYI
jgi:hypothetical protein